jgi:hypothetical protein
MIISASRRTDIPAFYSNWFMNRIRAGFVLVRNPFNALQLRHVSLAVADVDAIVFWTRNARKLIPHLPELDRRGYRYYFQYTITGYPSALEKSVPGLDQALRTFAELSEQVGPERVLWRYDPILLSSLSGIDEHRRRFATIAAALAGKTSRVTISVAEFYQKTRKNLGRVEGLTCTDLAQDPSQLQALVANLAGMAAQHGMDMHTCASGIDLTNAGATSGKCIDEHRLKTVFGVDYPLLKDKGQRPACGCVQSVDIGEYNTCLHGCAYCYATYNCRVAADNRARHDPESPLLVGRLPEAVSGP